MDTNLRKSKCEYCEKILKKGEGFKKFGRYSRKSFFVCLKGCVTDKYYNNIIKDLKEA